MVTVSVRNGPVHRGYVHGEGSLVRAGRVARNLGRYVPAIAGAISRTGGYYGGVRSAYVGVQRGVMAAREAAGVAKRLGNSGRQGAKRITDYFRKESASKRQKVMSSLISGNKKFKGRRHYLRKGRRSFRQYKRINNRY